MHNDFTSSLVWVLFLPAMGNVRTAMANFSKPPSAVIRTPPKRTLSATTPKNDVNFHQSVAGVFTVVQFLGIMPVTGTSQKDYRRVKFKWLTFRVAYTVIHLTFALALLFIQLERAMNTNLTVAKTTDVIFFLATSLCVLLFLNLARHWEKVIKYWSSNEQPFLHKPYSVLEGKEVLATRIVRLSLIILCTALIEHALALGSSALKKTNKVKICNITILYPYHFFLINEYAEVFQHLPFHITIGLLVEYQHTICTFWWNYMDLFIMIISLGLSTRFEQIHQRLEVNRATLTEWHWLDVKNHYIAVCEILHFVDRYIAPIVLLSCFNNLYYICYQLLNISTDDPSWIDYVYYLFSVGYLILRTTAIYWYAASINDASLKPLRIINRLPSSQWNIEVERFADQIRTDNVALSGMGFFSFTRKIMLTVAGTIVTYELVMMQLNSETKEKFEFDVQEYCDWIKGLRIQLGVIVD